MMVVERLSLDMGSLLTKNPVDLSSAECCDPGHNQHPNDVLKGPHQPANCPVHHCNAVSSPVSLGADYPAEVAHTPHSIDLHRVLPLGPVQDVGSSSDISTDDAKPKVMLGMLELGIVVHSVIIGMDLGVKTDKASAIVGLVIALCFHQFFEGLGLGACIASVMHDEESKVNWSKVRRSCFMSVKIYCTM
eukprot:765957-Hanusia_phi.AAC.1